MTESDLAGVLAEHDTMRLLHLLARHFFNSQRKIMSELDDLSTKVDTANAKVTASNQKIESLVALCNTNFLTIQQLLAGGTGNLTPDQLALIKKMSDSLDVTMSSLDAEDATVDSTIAADTQAPPAPPPAVSA